MYDIAESDHESSQDGQESNFTYYSGRSYKHSTSRLDKSISKHSYLSRETSGETSGHESSYCCQNLSKTVSSEIDPSCHTNHTTSKNNSTQNLPTCTTLIESNRDTTTNTATSGDLDIKPLVQKVSNNIKTISSESHEPYHQRQQHPHHHHHSSKYIPGISSGISSGNVPTTSYNSNYVPYRRQSANPWTAWPGSHNVNEIADSKSISAIAKMHMTHKNKRTQSHDDAGVSVFPVAKSGHGVLRRRPL